MENLSFAWSLIFSKSEVSEYGTFLRISKFFNHIFKIHFLELFPKEKEVFETLKKSNNPLFKAVIVGRLDWVKFLLYLNAFKDTNYNLTRIKLLNTAATYGRLNIIKFLIRKNSVDFNWPSYYAGMFKHVHIIDFLICYKYNNNKDITRYFTIRGAASGGHIDIIKKLMNGGNYKKNLKSAITGSCEKGNLLTLKFLFEKYHCDVYDWDVAMNVAVHNNQLEIINYLETNNADNWLY